MGVVKKRTWKRKDGSIAENWYIDFYDGSGQRIKQYGFKTKAAASAELAKNVNDVNTGNFVKQDKELKMNKAAADFLQYHANLHCKPSTIKSYESGINNYILPYFKYKKVVNINHKAVNEFIHYLKEQGLSAKTTNNYLTLLSTIFQKLVSDGAIANNPAAKVKRLQLPHREMRFLETEEIQTILEVAKKEYSDFYPLLLIAITTGMRRGEILGLTWDKINWKSKQIHVVRSLYRGQLIDPKTTNSIRRIDMSGELIKELKKWQIKCPVSEKNLVFPNTSGNYMDADCMVKRRFEPVIRKSGIEKIRFHDLRHTYASILIAQNIPIKYIQNQMGHSSIQVTMDRYGHLMPEVHQQGARVMDELFKKDQKLGSQIAL